MNRSVWSVEVKAIEDYVVNYPISYLRHIFILHEEVHCGA